MTRNKFIPIGCAYSKRVVVDEKQKKYIKEKIVIIIIIKRRKKKKQKKKVRVIHKFVIVVIESWLDVSRSRPGKVTCKDRWPWQTD